MSGAGVALLNGLWRPVLTYPFAATTTNINVFQRGTLLLGYTAIETTGAAPAEFDILDGNNPGGALIAPTSLTAGQSIRETFGAHGVYAQSGPYLLVNSGSIRGSIWYVDATEADLFGTDVTNL